jgi:hypothetical protein
VLLLLNHLELAYVGSCHPTPLLPSALRNQIGIAAIATIISKHSGSASLPFTIAAQAHGSGDSGRDTGPPCFTCQVKCEEKQKDDLHLLLNFLRFSSVYLNYRSPLTPKIAAAREFRKS